MNQLIPDDLIYAVNMLPSPLRQLMKQNPNRMIVAGGYVRDRILGEKPSDIDVFAPDRETAERWGDHLVAVLVAGDLICTRNAYTIKTKLPIQIIHRWTYNVPRQVVGSFDFTIAKGAIWYDQALADATGVESDGWTSMIDPLFYPDLAARRLRYSHPDRNEDAGGSLLRVLKFYQRGYRIPLDSLGGTIARLLKGTNLDGERDSEEHATKIFTGLLREVDPNIDPEKFAYRMSTTGTGFTEQYAQSNQV